MSMELRFVERVVPAPEYGEGTGKTIKILQYRCIEAYGSWRQGEQPLMKLGEWRDVPLVKEGA